MRIIETSQGDFDHFWKETLKRREDAFQGVSERVKGILDKVKREGDKALCELTQQLDGVRLEPEKLEIKKEDWLKAEKELDSSLKEALLKAKREIENFSRFSLPRDWMEVKEGLIRGEVFKPVEKVGLYVPGGRASYPSSVLMGVIPAVIAGVKEVIVVSPPPPRPVLLYAALISGASRFFQIGGAQAIGALAYGTESIPRVDLIAGPGNLYVQAAKKLLYGQVGIDILAGPSELLILSDGTTSPYKAALDLLSQAEHDEEAWALLITPDRSYAQRVLEEMKKLMEGFIRREIAEKSLKENGLIIIVRDLKEGMDLVNQFAPEHLELHLQEPWQWLGEVKNAGSVFVGEETSVAFGDYCGGTNHILPTGGAARFSSPLGVQNFLKRIQFLCLSGDKLKELAWVGVRLSEEEGLFGHREALLGRVKDG
jgi:histidinol dehydrogenase